MSTPTEAIFGHPSYAQMERLISAHVAENNIKKAYVGTPLTAANAAGMTDTSRVYVYTGSESGYTSGNWYYYDGSAWTSGGVYNSTAFETDDTLTIPDAAADSKAVGDELSNLKNALDDTANDVKRIYYNKSFTVTANTNLYIPIPLKSGEEYKIKNGINNALSVWTADTNKTSVQTFPSISSLSDRNIAITNDAVYLAFWSQTGGTVTVEYPDSFINDMIDTINEKTEKLESVIQINSAIYERKSVSASPNSATLVKNMTLSDYGVSVGDYLYAYAVIPTYEKFRVYASCYNGNTELVGYNYTNYGRIIKLSFRVPSNTTKIEFGVRNYNATDIIPFDFYVSKTDMVYNKLHGINLVAFGDSFVEGANNYQGSSKSFVNIIAERNNMNLHNYGVSGATFVKTLKPDGVTYRNCIVEDVDDALIELDASLPNVIVICGGYNDSQSSINNPLGTFSDNDFSGNYDSTTILGAIETAFYKLRNGFYYNNSDIVKTPLIVFALEPIETASPIWTTNRKSIRLICEKWGIPVIDMNTCLGVINTTAFTLRSAIFSDGTHPNSDGYMMIANGVENQIRTWFER